MKISPYCDRETCVVSSSQLSFIDFVVGPLFEALGKYVKMDPILEQLKKNKETWADRLAILQATKSPTTT